MVIFSLFRDTDAGWVKKNVQTPQELDIISNDKNRIIRWQLPE